MGDRVIGSGGMRVSSVQFVGLVPRRSPESRHHPFEAAAFLRDNRIADVRGGDPGAMRAVAAVLGQSVRNLLHGKEPAVDLPKAARFLCDFDVLAARTTTADRDLGPVLADLDGTARGLAGLDDARAAEVRALAVALRRSSGILRLAPGQLPEQLLFRLGGRDGPLLGRLVRRAAAYKSGGWLKPLTTTAGGWRETVTYLRGSASAVGFDPAGRLVVVDDRRWLEVLDLSGAEPPLLYRTGDGEPTGLACDDTIAAVPTREGPIRLVEFASGRRDPLVPDSGATLTVAFAGPGRLASGGTDGLVRLWDVARGVELDRFDAGEVVHVLLPIDADTLLVGTDPDAGTRTTIQRWNLRTRRREGIFADHYWPVTALALDADAGLVVAAANDELSAWRLRDLSCAWRVTTEHVTFHSLARLGDRILAGDNGGALRLLALGDGTELGRVPPHGGLVPAIAVDAARGRFVTGSYDQTVRLWDAAALAEPGTPRHRERVSALAPAPGGDLLLSGSHDGRVLRWDARTCAPRGEIGRHGHWVSGVVALPGGRAVSSGWDGTLRTWDLYRSGPIATIATGDDHIARLACTPDGGLAVTASTDSVIRVWDLASGDQRASITAPDGRVVAVDVHGDVVRWVVESGRLFSWRPGSDESPAVRDLLGADGVPADAGRKVTACRIGAPGGTVLAGLSDGRILGAGTDGRTEIFAGDGCGPAAITCDPSGGLVLAAYGVPRAASDNTARLWTGRERESSAVLVGDLPWTAAAVAPDGRLLYLGDEAGAVHVVEPVPPGVNRPDRGPGSR